MTVPSESPRFFRLYHCTAHGHYHILFGDNASWPIWSRPGFATTSSYIREAIIPDMLPEDRPVAESELDQVVERAKVLARTQRRVHGGPFKRGFLLQRDTLPGESHSAESWVRFRSGESPCVVRVTEELIGTMVFPLTCDFVGRAEPLPAGQSLTRAEWARLAEVPARYIAPSELGIAFAA